MGRFFAAAIIAVATLKLGPMCARLPSDLSKVSGGEPAPAAAPAAAVEVPAVSTAAAAPPPPAPAAWPAERAAVTVSTYRMKKMFNIANGKAMVSVSVKNVSESPARDLKLTLTATLAGKRAERWTANVFDLAASSSVYRGLRLEAATLDAVLAEAPAAGTELRWDLSYLLDGEQDRRCYALRALPRTREPEGVEWKTLEAAAACPKP